jgi:hypothetical protein
VNDTQLGEPGPDQLSATPRGAPYVWATWLVDLMAGARCQWRYWFLSHFKLREKARVFDDPSWQVRHTRMLTELERELQDQGLQPEIEYAITLPIGKQGAQLAGSIDCLTDDDVSQTATVYECKTGAKKQKHTIQTWLYMNMLTRRARFRDKGIRGSVVYGTEREEHRGIPDDFGSHVEFYEQLLVSDRPPRKSPGAECRFCPITAIDCPDRQTDFDYDLLDEGEGGST